jgi:hypothetical protein
MIRFLPGLTGAFAAYIVLFLVRWINSGWVHATVFFVVYLVVAIATDKAMATYRRPDEKT